MRWPWQRKSYMLLSAGGNAIASWSSEEEARAGLAAMLELEPEAAEEVVLMVFDHKGMATHTLYPFDES